MTDEKAETIRDISVEKFAELVLASDAELAKEVKLLELDVVSILKKQKPEADKYTIQTGVSMGRGRIREAITEKNSKVVKGMVVGSSDRYGSNAPIRIPILVPKGDHIEASFWGASVKYKDSKIEIPIPSTITARVLEKDYRGRATYNLIAVDDYEQIDMATVINRLAKIAKPAPQVSYQEGEVVVLSGRISFIEPAPIFKDQQRVGEFNVVMENARDIPMKHLVLQVSLNSEGTDNRVRVSFSRQKQAAPTIAVTDMLSLAMDAMSKAPSSPREQAAYIGTGLRDVPVLVVGTVTKVKRQNDTNYVEVAGYGIFDSEPSAGTKNWFGGEEKAAEKPAAPAPAPKEEKKEAPAPKEEKKEEKPLKKPTKKGSSDALTILSGMKITDADTLKSWITSYCLLLKVKPDVLTVDMIKGVSETDLPDAVIGEVLSEMQQ